jgi:hypothetical protein
MSTHASYQCIPCLVGATRYWQDICNAGALKTNDESVYFKHVEKAACTTVKYLSLCLTHPELLNAKRDSFAVHAEDTLYAWVHECARLCTVPFSQALKAEATRITFYRNPYSRLVSTYLDKLANPCPAPAESDTQRFFNREILLALKGSSSKHKLTDEEINNGVLSFSSFVAYVCSGLDTINDIHWRRQVDINAAHLIPYAHIVRAESFDTDIAHVHKHYLQLDLPPIPRLNATTHTTSLNKSSFYNEAIAATVYNFYKCDFEVFGYSEDSYSNL